MKLNCLYVICSQKNYDKTFDPRSFSEKKIGKLLDLCENLPIVKYQPNAIFNLDTEPSDVCIVKMYLYEISYSVSSEIVPESLVNKHPANTNYARWLPTANKVLRLFVATESLGENLLIPVNIILKV